MDAYFARQPILDKNLNLFGYELLFRPNPKVKTAGDMVVFDGDRATASVLDAVNVNGLDKVTGGNYAFVNFTRNLLLDGIPTLYPRELLAVEVLEDVEADDEVLKAVRSLKEKGYLIALDDYVYRPGDEPLIELANVIKVEVGEDDDTWKNLKTIAKKINLKKCRLLAEKVENEDIFEKAKALGCSLFQGYFFAKPKTMSSKTVTPLKINIMRLVRELTKPDFNFDVVAEIIKNDVGLSFKTLRLVNSVYYGALHRIENINQAVVYLGRNELRKWLTFSSMSELCDDKPSELIIMSMVRASFCEELARRIGQKERDAYFLTGLFSMLDTMMDCPLEECLSMLTVPKIATDALLEEHNMGRYMLDLIMAIEKGKWETVSEMCERLGVADEAALGIYYDSLQWTQKFAAH